MLCPGALCCIQLGVLKIVPWQVCMDVIENVEFKDGHVLF